MDNHLSSSYSCLTNVWLDQALDHTPSQASTAHSKEGHIWNWEKITSKDFDDICESEGL